MDKEELIKRKPKRQTPKKLKLPKKGISDKYKRVLYATDGKIEKIVSEDVKRDPGKRYFYKQEAN